MRLPALVSLALLAAACSHHAPEEPPDAVFTFGALQGEARWIGNPEQRPEIRLTFHNAREAPVYWRGEPSNSREGWRQPPRDAQGYTWYGGRLPLMSDTFEEDEPFSPPNQAIWRLTPGTSRNMTLQPFRGLEPGPREGFTSWEYAVALCLPSDQPPAHPLDYRTADLRLRWSRDAGLSVRLAE